nr:MAG TPA: hypothetical protein [Caudoviricetes sp.]
MTATYNKSLTLRQVLEVCPLANWEVFDINNEGYPIFTYETPLGVAINGCEGASLTRIMRASVETIEANQNQLIITIDLEA